MDPAALAALLTLLGHPPVDNRAIMEENAAE
jgi:hypothetical protein